MNLEIGGTRLRVACPHRIGRRLRAALRDHLTDEEAPLGFLVRPRTMRQRRYVVIDRGGFRLGSAERIEHVLAMLASHLSALLPLPSGQVRLRGRLVVADGAATFCTYPVLFAPPLDEDELTQMGLTLANGLAVDFDANAAIRGPLPSWPRLAELASPPGQSSGDALVGSSVDRIVVASTGSAPLPSGAQVVATLCREALAGPRESVINVATDLASTARLVMFDVRVAGGLVTALR